MTWLLEGFFHLLLAMSTSSTMIHLPLLLPSCPPHLSHVGGKEEGGSQERFLWCCRRSCYAVSQICEGSCSSSSAVARHWDNVPCSVFHSSLFFLFSLPYGAAVIPTFRPCSLCFPIQHGVVPQWSPCGAGLPLDRPWHGQTRLLGHLSQVSVCSELSHMFDAATSRLQGFL